MQVNAVTLMKIRTRPSGRTDTAEGVCIILVLNKPNHASQDAIATQNPHKESDEDALVDHQTHCTVVTQDITHPDIGPSHLAIVTIVKESLIGGAPVSGSCPDCLLSMTKTEISLLNYLLYVNWYLSSQLCLTKEYSSNLSLNVNQLI